MCCFFIVKHFFKQQLHNHYNFAYNDRYFNELLCAVLLCDVKFMLLVYVFIKKNH